MKKIAVITILAGVAQIPLAQASFILDPGFDAGALAFTLGQQRIDVTNGLGGQGADGVAQGVTNIGWGTNALYYDFASNTLENTGVAFPRSFGQTWTDYDDDIFNNSFDLTIDYNATGSSDVTIFVQLYGFVRGAGTGVAAGTSTGQISFYNDTDPAGGGSFDTVDTLVDATLLIAGGDSGGVQNWSISLNGGASITTNYDGFGIRIGQLTAPSAVGTLAFDNVQIAPVPEPSTYGIFAGLGVLTLVALRRRK